MFLKSSLQMQAEYENNMATREQEGLMVAKVKDIVIHHRAALVEDMLGVGALFIGLFLMLGL